MCGIAGLINSESNNLENIVRSLKHRGPDDNSIFKHKNLTLIHTRLAVQDINGGSQPFIIGNFVIIFNGEIYNHKELRSKLRRIKCRTNSDTETFLALYIEFGNRAFEYCDGMFAFAILDKEKNEVILGRDRLGVKPLFVYQKNEKIFFASELNTIIQEQIDIELNEESLSAYLNFGFTLPNETPYKNISNLEPGHILKINLSNLKQMKYKYFSLEEGFILPNLTNNSDELNEEFDELLRKSIKNRIISSDRDIGIFLSSGIDSTLITAIASEYSQNLKTFTVKFGNEFDESLLAKKVAKSFGTDHYEISLSPNLEKDIDNILNLHGEPFFDSSFIPSYYISKEASKYITVALNGDGADEFLGGYRRYVPSRYNLYSFFRNRIWNIGKIPLSVNKFSKINYWNRLIYSSEVSGLEFYRRITNSIYPSNFVELDNSFKQKFEYYFSATNSLPIDEMSKIQISDIKFLLEGDLLRKMDIASMAFSVEARSPFLSKYLIDFSSKLPQNFKVNHFETKYLLRKVASNYLPPQIFSQKKKGFEIPLNNLVNNDLRTKIFDTITSNTYLTNFINSKKIHQVLNRVGINDENQRSKMLWSMFTFATWHNNFVSKQKKQITFSKVPKVPKVPNVAKLKVLYLTTGLGLGGAEKVIYDIINNLDKNSFDPYLVSISNQAYLKEDFKKILKNVEILGNKKSFISLVKSVNKILNIVKAENIQVIHAHMFHTLVLASIVKVFRREIKIVFTPHSIFYKMPFRRIIIWCLKPLRSIDTIFSSKLRSSLFKKQFTVIPNGLDIKNFEEYKTSKVKDDKKFHFLVVGRLEEMKNHSFLINLFSEIKDHNIHLTIIGTGKLDSSLKHQVNVLGLNDKIDFLGLKKDIREQVVNSHCLLIASLWEAFPINMLEAAIMKLPIISTRVGAIDTFLDSSNSYLTDLKNYKNTMLYVMQNYEEALSKSNILYEKLVKDYDVKYLVKLYESAYKAAST